MKRYDISLENIKRELQLCTSEVPVEQLESEGVLEKLERGYKILDMDRLPDYCCELIERNQDGSVKRNKYGGITFRSVRQQDKKAAQKILKKEYK